MKSLVINFSKILKIVQEFGFELSRMISSKDGTKVLVKANVKMIYSFAKIYQNKGFAEVVENSLEFRQIENYEEIREARRYLKNNFDKLNTDSFWESEVYDSYPYSEIAFSKRGRYLQLNVEVSRSLNLAQIWRTGNILNVEENFDAFYELKTHKREVLAKDLRNSLSKLKKTLEVKFVGSSFERLFGLKKEKKPFSLIWYGECINL